MNTSMLMEDSSFNSRTRLLRANLLQPLKDRETINARLECLVGAYSFFLYFIDLGLASLICFLTFL